MSNPIVDDLRFAQQAERMVEVSLFNGTILKTGVHSVDEENGFVTFYAPVAMGDKTTKRLAIADITTINVTSIEYHAP